MPEDFRGSWRVRDDRGASMCSQGARKGLIRAFGAGWSVDSRGGEVTLESLCPLWADR